MGVYIKGMTAQQARMWLNYHMPFTFIVTNDDITEVPEPHGRLIDENEVIKRMHAGAWGAIYELDVRGTPTVIEAEGEQ